MRAEEKAGPKRFRRRSGMQAARQPGGDGRPEACSLPDGNSVVALQPPSFLHLPARHQPRSQGIAISKLHSPAAWTTQGIEVPPRSRRCPTEVPDRCMSRKEGPLEWNAVEIRQECQHVQR